MTDQFIDQDEVSIYGAYASARLRAYVAPLLPAMKDAVIFLADSLDEATSAVESAVAHAKQADAEARAGVREKTPALDGAVALLGRFSKHLDAHPAGSVDKKTFFVKDGTAGAVGRSAHRVALAVGHIALALKKGGTAVDGADKWHKEFASAAKRLSTAIDHAGSAKTDRHDLSPEVEHARLVWDSSYLAAKDGARAVLRLAGHLDRLSTVFHDLAVPAGAKVTAAPAPPADPPPPAHAAQA